MFLGRRLQETQSTTAVRPRPPVAAPRAAANQQDPVASPAARQTLGRYTGFSSSVRTRVGAERGEPEPQVIDEICWAFVGSRCSGAHGL